MAYTLLRRYGDQVTFPEVLIRAAQCLIILYLIQRFRQWRKEISLKKPFKFERNDEPYRPLFQKEAKLRKDDRILNVAAGFCINHPDETRLIVGKGRNNNDCYSCRREGRGRR